MNRSLTAAAAILAVFGTAGLALAQTPGGPAGSTGTNGGAPSAAAPAAGMTPAPSQTPSQAPSQAAPPAPSAQPPRAADSSSESPSLTQEVVVQAQRELRAHGLYNGPIDGIVGPLTQSAVSRFQQQEGLPQTAELDQQTMDRLMQIKSSPSTR